MVAGRGHAPADGVALAGGLAAGVAGSWRVLSSPRPSDAEYRIADLSTAVEYDRPEVRYVLESA